MSNAWYVYLVRTADRALYTGIATDVRRRLDEHRSGRGSKFLRGRGPLTLAFERQVGDRGLALRIEHAVKQLSKTRKESLVTGGQEWTELLQAAQPDLGERRTQVPMERSPATKVDFQGSNG